MIRVSSLNKTFVSRKSPPGLLGAFKPKIETRFTAVQDLSFTAEAGEFFALLGPNGAGKTTTLKMLAGILTPTSGLIDVFGYIPQHRTNEFKRQISFVMAHKTQLFLELPVQDTFEFIAAAYRLDPNDYRRTLEMMVERFELGDKLQTVGRRLSLGQRMKCELVCALLYHPRIIFLDEPTIGLDINSAHEVRRFLRQINKDSGTTIILTTHNMQDVEELCPRTIVINHGRVAFDGRTDELKRLFGGKREIEFILSDSNSEQRPMAETFAGPSARIIEWSDTRLIVEVEQPDTIEVMGRVMKALSVAEVNFHEPDLSVAIGKLYRDDHVD